MRCEAATYKFVFSQQQSSSMEVLCIIAAALEVLPHRSQFFLYENISLSCVEPGLSSEWRLKRNTTTNKNEECSVHWGKISGSRCYVDLYILDTGVYWCEFGAGMCSDAVNITVTGGPVILESPARPVQEGEAATLRCRTSHSNATGTAGFYKDDLLIGTSSTGNITIHSVSRADEGLYKCDIDGVGESKSSWLTVRGRRPGSSLPHLFLILLPVLGFCVLLALITLLHLRRKHKGQLDPEVSYTDVTFTQEVQVRRDPGNTDQQLFFSSSETTA